MTARAFSSTVRSLIMDLKNRRTFAIRLLFAAHRLTEA